MYLSPSHDRSSSTTCVAAVGLNTACNTSFGCSGASSVSASSQAVRPTSAATAMAMPDERSENNADPRRRKDGELGNAAANRWHHAVVEDVQQHIACVVRVHHAEERADRC